MRSDPREINYRKVHDEDSGLFPKKNASSRMDTTACK